MDVIARCAFGLEIDSLGNKNDPFIENAQYVFHAPANKSPAIMLPNMYPKMFNFLLDRLFVTKHLRFFTELLDGVIRERSQSPQKFNDFIEAATEAIGSIKKDGANGQQVMWTKEQVEEIVMGQSTLFMIAGGFSIDFAIDSTFNRLLQN